MILRLEEVAALRVLARTRAAQEQAQARIALLQQEAEHRAPTFLEFLEHVYVQPDMDREDYDPEVQFSPRGGVQWQPWPYLTERATAWANRESEVVLKARQLGISWLAAAFTLWSAQYHPYFHVAVFSVGQREAKVQLARSRFIYENLEPAYQRGVKFNTEDALCDSGSVIVAFPSTEHTGISFTFRLVIRDESSFHPYGAANYAAVRPTLSAGGQFIDMSTANPKLGPSGDFHDRYWASKRGETGYAAVFIPWHARPGRDAVWLARERAAYVGLTDEFDAYYPGTDAEAFVARSGLVYPQFSEARHVRTARIPLTQCVRAVAGVDWGGGDPTAVAILGLEPRHHAHQYAEFARRGSVGVDAIAAFIARYPTVRQVRCGADEPVAIATLQTTLGPGYDVQAADTRRAEGLGLVAFLLEHDRLTIEPDCTQSIAEFPGYRWAERADPLDRTRYATKTPVDHHADLHDARRYACAELLAVLHDPGVQLPKPRDARRARVMR